MPQITRSEIFFDTRMAAGGLVTTDEEFQNNKMCRLYWTPDGWSYTHRATDTYMLYPVNDDGTLGEPTVGSGQLVQYRPDTRDEEKDVVIKIIHVVEYK